MYFGIYHNMRQFFASLNVDNFYKDEIVIALILLSVYFYADLQITWLSMQQIFDNIMNRNIPWPKVPEEISHEAYDLIEK